MSSIKSLGQGASDLGGMIINVTIVLVFVGKLALSSSIGTDAQESLGTVVGYLDDYFDWIALIILIGVIVYLKNASKGAMD